MITFTEEEQRTIEAKPWIYKQEDPKLAVQALLRDLGHPDHVRNTELSYQRRFTLLVKVAASREKVKTESIGDFLDEIARGGRPRVYELKEALLNQNFQLGHEAKVSVVTAVQHFLTNKRNKRETVEILNSLCSKRSGG